jgi:YegS/Rv2252/BmrU family lipid kinase
VADTLAIVNPKSNRGRTARRWSRVEAEARRVLGDDLEVSFTQGPGDAERLACEGARAGARRIVVAGGDGTASEVATGLLAAGLAPRTALGFLPLGTGSDFVRSLGLPRDPVRAIVRIAHGAVRKLDVGRLAFVGDDGRQSVRYFLNVASAGLPGRVDRLMQEQPSSLGGAAAFLVATLRALAGWRDVHCRVELDGALLHDGAVVLVAAANASSFGSGMRVAPHACSDDGRLDVVVVRSLSKLRLVANLPRVYFGGHVGHPAVLYRQGRRLNLETTEGELALDVDGEPFSARRLQVELLPGAIQVLGAERAI